MNLKSQVGIAAASYVKNHMTVGLGTGSTAAYLVAELGRRVQEENLIMTGVTTSAATKIQALALGIPLKDLDEVAEIDVTIDGADEISPDFHGIKGGGAALLHEKIVASYSKKNIWIVDDSKLVTTLGQFPLPVEVIPFGSQQLLKKLAAANLQPVLRLGDDQQPLLTDSGHYLIDLHLQELTEPEKLDAWLKTLPGVVETGLFLAIVDLVLVGKSRGVETLIVPQRPKIS